MARFGPARDAPRVQRWLLRRPTWVQGLVMTATISASLGLAMWIVRGRVPAVGIAFLVLSVPVGAAYFARAERGVTEEERMNRTVMYSFVPSFSYLREAIPRRYLIILALVCVVGFLLLVVSGSIVGAGMSGAVALVLVGAVASSAAEPDNEDRT